MHNIFITAKFWPATNNFVTPGNSNLHFEVGINTVTLFPSFLKTLSAQRDFKAGSKTAQLQLSGSINLFVV